MKDEILSLDKKIQSTEDELNRLKQQLNPSSTEYVFSSAVLVKRLLDLKEQKRELETQSSSAAVSSPSEELEEPLDGPSEEDNAKRDKMKLILSGKGIGYGSIPIRVLSNVLSQLQGLTDQISQAIHLGPTLTEHKIPPHILSQSELKMTQAFSGSFGMELQPSQEAGIRPSIEKLFRLFKTSHYPGQFMEEIASLGPKTLELYRQWIDGLAEQGVNLKCHWDAADGKGLEWTGDREDFDKMRKTIDSIRLEKSREMIVRGTFLGMNIRNNTFELLNEESDEIIEGKSPRELLMEYRLLIGDRTTVKLIKCCAENLATGEERTIFYLREVLTS